MRLSAIIKILMIIHLVTLSSCGRTFSAMGGIVDNGNTDETPPVEHESKDSASPAQSVISVKIALFDMHHFIEVPGNFAKSAPDQVTEVFSLGSVEVLRLGLVSSSCSASESFVNKNGARVGKCSDENGLQHWTVEASNGDLIEVISSLEELTLKSILDTLE